MKRNSPSKLLSVFLAFVMLIPLFTGTINFDFANTASAADAIDEFSWNFTDQPAGMPLGTNIEEESQNTIGQGQTFINLLGRSNFTAIHSSGTTGGSGEGPENLLVDNQSSKWCATNVNSSNAWFIFDAGEPVYKPYYAIRSANDCASNTGRFLHTWTIEGSNDPSGSWTVISSPGAQGTGWNANYQIRVFDFNSDFSQTSPFRYFRLNITYRSNTATGTALSTSNTTMQFSYIGLVEGMETVGFEGQTEYLLAQVMNGMTNHWAGSRLTMNGPNTLLVSGSIASGTGNVDAKSYTNIKSSLNIAVHPDTKFNYMFAPEGVITSASSNNYDYKYHGAHMALDLKFSDGTRLKDIPGAIDQYGIGIHPDAQGDGKVHKTYQWNFVEVELGKFAAGKVITDIIVGFEMDDATRGQKAAGWFDDINIFRCPYGMDYSKIDPADFVDIRQGANASTNATGAMVPSVAVPNGFQYFAPTTTGRADSNKYAWSNTSMHGITSSKLASRHMGERLTFLFMANSTTTSTSNINVNNAVNTSNADFTHDNEFAYSNYHYGVTFNTDDAWAPGVSLEVTPTVYGAAFRFTFPAGSAARNVLFAAPHSTTNNYSSMVWSDSSNSFAGWAQNGSDTNSTTQGNGALRRNYLYGEFSATPTSFTIPATTSINSMASFPDLQNGPNGETIVEMRLVTSFISADQALKNFSIDMIGRAKEDATGIWTIEDGKWFEAIKAESKAVWNKALGAVKFEDSDANYWQYMNFYSKLARSQLFPTLLAEYTGQGSKGGWQYSSPYRGTNANPTIMDGYMIYNEGWWDTFKSKWPLLGLLYPVRSENLTDGIIQHYIDQDGRGTSNGSAMPVISGGHAVPRWINPGGNNMMTGTSSDAIISHNYVNGIGFHNVIDGYYSWLKSSAVVTPSTAYGGRTGLHIGMFKGYHPYNSSAAAGGGGQLDTTWSLEGYLNDASQVHMLKKMAAEVDADTTIEGFSGAYWKQRWEDEALYYESRAKQYVNLFNPALGGWFRNKNSDGSWRETDSAFNPLNWGTGYCEDNAWPYRFLVPQDGNGLANLMGGKKALREALDAGFNAEGTAMNYEGGGYGGWIHEGTEKREVKMGQFGLSNQPAYHMPWIYLHSDQPWKTQYWTRISRPRAYSGEAIGYGYMGEEDNGAMASWYVWATLGLYPLDLGSGQLVISSPEFKKTIITDENGKTITINAANNSFENLYIQSMKVNGEDYHKLYLDASMLKANLVIDYVMGPEPSETWFTEAPPSLTKGDDMPTALADLTTENTTRISGDVPADQTTVVLALTGITTSNAENLFDNNAGNTTTADDAIFSSTTPSIVYFDPVAPKVQMYTMTSAYTSGTSAPSEWTFSGSNDGAEWIVLDQRSGEVFNWRKYTRPFAVTEAKQGNYKYYKLDITAVSNDSGSLALAQMELLADKYARITPALLEETINAAQAVLDSGVKYGQDTVDTLETVLAEARAMLAESEDNGFKLNQMISKVNTGVSGLIRIRHVTELRGATEFNATSGPGTEMTSGIPNTNGGAPNAWIAYKYIDFGDADDLYDKVSLTYAADSASCNNGSSIEVRIDSITGPIVAIFDRNSPVTNGVANANGNWTTGSSWSGYREITVSTLQQVNGVHDVYLVLRTGSGTPNQWVANIRYFNFSDEPVPFVVDKTALSELIVAVAEYEEIRYTASTWAALNSVLVAAIDVSEGALYTQSAVDAALATLQAAIDNLQAYAFITFDSNGGSEVAEMRVLQGQPVAEPATQRFGYTFDGWYLGEEEYNFETLVMGDIILVAKWLRIPIMFIRITNTQGVPAAASITVIRNSTIQFDYAINKDAIREGIVWTVSNPAYASVDEVTGTVRIKNFTGSVVLMAKDSLNGAFQVIVLRIV